MAPNGITPPVLHLHRAVSLALFALLIQPINLYAAVQRNVGYGMPRDVSTEGWRIDRLINSTLVFVTLLFLIMVIWLVAACIRYPRTRKAAYSAGDDRRSIRNKLLVAAAIFIGVDGNLFVNSSLDLSRTFWNFAAIDSNPKALRVEINARQWAWQVRYAGADGVFKTPDDVVTLNDLRVPVGTPVSLQLGAVDVIHSLYLPNFRIKQDIVPGTITQAWFQATDTGTFEIACAQHCGTHHYKMRGQLTVQAPEDFRAWMQEAAINAQLDHDPSEESWGWAWQKI